MANIVKRVAKEPLSFDDLKRMIRKGLDITPDKVAENRVNGVKFIRYDELKSYSSLEDLFESRRGEKGFDCIIILLQIEAPHAPRVGHWITLLDHSSYYEHFDSYGLDIDEELAITHEKPYLRNLFRDTSKRIDSNNERLQRFREDVNTCGRWAVARCLFVELTLDEYKKFIKSVHLTPDLAVTLLTMFL